MAVALVVAWHWPAPGLPDDIDDPVVPLAGDAPTSNRVLVGLAADGRPTLDGEAMAWDAFGGAFSERANADGASSLTRAMRRLLGTTPQPRDPLQLSEVNVVLALPASTRCADAQPR